MLGLLWLGEGFEEEEAEVEKVEEEREGVIVFRPHFAQRGDSRGASFGEVKELLRAERRG